MLFFCSKNCKHLCKKISNIFKKKYSEIILEKFPDGEINVSFKENVNNKTIFFFKNLFKPINDSIIETLMVIRSFKKHNSGKVFLVSPYLGYSRSDRESENSFNCVSSKLIADLLETAGLDGLFTVDLHTKQISSFYTIPVININTFPVIKNIVKNRQLLFPDFGSLKRFTNIIDSKKYKYSVLHKYRNKNGIKIFGNKKKKKILLIDDIIDTGETLIKSLKKIKKKDKKVFCTHAVFSKSVKKIAKKANLKKIYITNTIKTKKTKYLDIKNVSKLIFNEIKKYV